ncbi:NAD-dependent epimerase/dehydratase family protein [Sediminibacterium sp.]|uniref:polysaccharide biosynthesis C-terminal domain-containing protein n=1 Tax=Sediminibacterium sp. TaxID=1917865 RepID=UPI00272FC790|nr:NAD-dependent epimerase/dehydratase family protein [Sediminibacterium sp.]MDP2420252.1 NAD-dependent epimerase/dehydratase family protein [Sediminibacterium sp.]
MRKVGITGSNGFVGYHLYQTLSLYKEAFFLVEFDRSFFDNNQNLDSFVSSCDVIVHLAALNRHNDSELIYQTNISLVKKLVAALERTDSKAHLIISSSTQEQRDNFYGKSKKDGRLLLSNWAKQSGGRFTGLIIPNVFGPFGHAFYNSVIATFCHQISNGETPNIDVDGELKLIYVSELVEEIIKLIHNNDNSHELLINYTAQAKVSEILNLLNYFRKSYQDRGEIPILNNDFEQKLFNTYRCYMDISAYFPKKFLQHSDDRGAFVEIARQGIPGQTSFSTTLPGITRGNHFHTRKIERFAVIKGRALIQLRRIGTQLVHDFYLDGDEPAYVDMPIWYAHNIKNIGEDTLYTIFWINEPFNRKDPDTYLEIV